MAIVETADQLITEELREFARRLDDTPHGRKGAILKEIRERYGWSKDKVYRQLEQRVGWTSQRKKRKDAGTTSQCGKSLDDLAATIRLGFRKNGKQTMEIPNAVSMLSANKRDFSVSNGRLAQLLKARSQDAKSAKKDTPHIHLRSKHPNHVHQVDPSLCLVYYLRGKQYVMREDEFYKNKLDKYAQVKLKVWRYVLVDHKSATVIVRYYESAGESQKNLYDFLLYAWSRMDGRPFHGVPFMMVWDKGSANASGAIRNAMRGLGVELYAHKKGAPRVKGLVEGHNNIVEKLFESRLRYEPVDSCEELNEAVEGGYNAYNADRIPNYDARLRRPFMDQPAARYALWQTIRKEHLRILPDDAVCRELLTADAVTRVVRNDMEITYKHPMTKRREAYRLKGIPGVEIGIKVELAPRVYGSPGEINVYVTDYRGDQTAHIVAPIAFDRQWGERLDSPVWGEEFASAPYTDVERAGKRAEQAAFPGMNDEERARAIDKGATPFNGEIDAHSHLQDVELPAYMNRPGEEIEVGAERPVAVRRFDTVEAVMELADRLGGLTADQSEALYANYPNGINEDELDAIAEEIRGGGQPLAIAVGDDRGLRVVK